MRKGHWKALTDKYGPAFLALVFLFLSYSVRGQSVYRPSNTGYFTPANKPYGLSTPVPTDGRTYKADTVNGLFRPYNGTAEVLTYLPTGSQFRVGQFPIVINVGGSLQSNGLFVGGQIQVWWFLRGQADTNLVRMDSVASGTCPACLLKANNLSDVQSLFQTLINLNLNNVDNTSDATKWAATATVTNKTFSGVNNTFTNIPNSALSNNSIGLTLNNTGTTPGVTTTPAALGTSLALSIPFGNGTNTGFIRNTDWAFFNGKLDSVHVSNDSVYNCVNGTCTLQSVIAGGTGAVLSVSNSDGSLLFSPTTGNVLGSINTAHSNTWTGQQTFNTSAPIFGTLTTNGGVFYGNGSGLLLQSVAGTSGQIFESQGSSGPIFFTPGPSTVNGWLGYTALSNALGSTHIFVGNGSNIATDVPVTGDISFNNAGLATIVRPFVDTIYRTPGKDSLQFTIGGRYHSILDSAGGGGGGAVSSVSNSDGTLTISPTTGAVVASLALGHGNTWITNPQTFNGGLALGSSVTFGTDNTYSIGSPTAVANGLYTRFLESNNILNLITNGANPIGLSPNSVTKLEVLASGQIQFNGYTTATSFTGTPLAFLGTDASGNVVQTAVGSLQTTLSNTPSGGFPLFNANSSAIRELFAGTNITMDTTTHTGGVTINASGGGGGITQLFAKYPVHILGTDTVIGQTFYGSIYQANSWSNTSAFTNSGSTVSVVGNGLQFTGGSGTFTQTLGLNGPSMLDKWAMSGYFTVGTSNGTSYGFGIGKKSINTYTGYDALGRFVMSTGTGSGTIILNGGNTDQVLATSASALTFSVGDTIFLSVWRDGYVINASAYDKTTNSASITASYTYSTYPNAEPYFDNTGLYSIYSLGGTFTLDSLSITSNQVKYGIQIGGDSKWQGYDVTSQANRVSDLLNNNFNATGTMSGGSDRTIELSAHCAEIIAFHPPYFIMGIGSNDVRWGGESPSVYYARYDSICTALTNAGIQVFHAPLYETSISLAALYNHIVSTYPASNIFPTYQAMQLNGALDAGGVHPNNHGDSLIYYAILHNYSFTGGKPAIASSIGGIGGSVTAGYIPIATATNTLGNSLITYSSPTITIPTNTVIGATGLSGTVALTVKGDANLDVGYYAFGSQIYNLATNDARTAGVDYNIGGLTTRLGNVTSSASFNEDARIDANGRFLIGATSALGTAKTEITSTSQPQLTLAYDGTHNVSFQVNSVNYLLLSGLGGFSMPDAALQAGSTGDSLISFVNSGGNAILRKIPSPSAQTLQQVLTAGAILTTNNTVNVNGHQLSFTGGTVGIGTTAVSTAWLSVGLPASGNSAITFILGAKQTTMGQGDLDPVTGHLWYHDGVDYDLENHVTAAGQLTYATGAGVLAATATPAHAGMRPVWDGSVVKWTDTTASGGGSQTLQQVLTTGSTLTGTNNITNTGQILTLTNGGTGLLEFSGISHDTTASFGLLGMANDSSVRAFSWAAVAAKVSPLLPTFNVFAANGLTGAGGDSIYLGGTLNQNTTINLGTNTLNLTGTGGGIINLFASLDYNYTATTDANYTVTEGVPIYYLAPGITANRTITLPTAGTSGRTIVFYNGATTSFSWSFASSVSYLDGSALTTLSPNTWYTIICVAGQWLVLNSYAKARPISYNHTVFTPTTGGTVALVNNQYNIINPSGTLATLTVNLPSSPSNNDVIYIKYTQAVTTVTYGNGTVVDGITSPISGGLVILTYDSGTTSWY